MYEYDTSELTPRGIGAYRRAYQLVNGHEVTDSEDPLTPRGNDMYNDAFYKANVEKMPRPNVCTKMWDAAKNLYKRVCNSLGKKRRSTRRSRCKKQNRKRR